MNEQTKKFVAEIVANYNGDTEKAAKWIHKLIRCGIREARNLIAEAAK